MLCVTPTFRVLHLLLAFFVTKKTTVNLWKMTFFFQDPPRWKLVLFVKMAKIMHNVNIRADTVFYKKCVTFPKKCSDKIRPFSLVVYRWGTPPHFWSLPLVIDDTQQKNKTQFVKNGSIYPDVSPLEKIGHFHKNDKIMYNVTIRTVSALCKKM